MCPESVLFEGGKERNASIPKSFFSGGDGERDNAGWKRDANIPTSLFSGGNGERDEVG